MNEEMNEHDSNQENDVGGKEQDSSKFMPQFNSTELSAPIDNSEDRNAELEFSRKNDDLIWVNGRYKGYVSLDITEEYIDVSFKYVSTVKSKNYKGVNPSLFRVEHSKPFLS